MKPSELQALCVSIIWASLTHMGLPMRDREEQRKMAEEIYQDIRRHAVLQQEGARHHES